MPELPEVEVLVRHLRPRITRKVVREVTVYRPKTAAPTSPEQLAATLKGARIQNLSRRGKYLVFDLQCPGRSHLIRALGHLGMTGRMYLLPARAPLPKHTALILHFGRDKLVFEDTRYFGRLTLDTSPLNKLGWEPLDPILTPTQLAAALSKSSQSIKVKLLDQTLLAGVGNIYASEALFHARISPFRTAHSLTLPEIRALLHSIRRVLTIAINRGSTLPIDFAGYGPRNGLFYFGTDPNAKASYRERLRVYDRANRPCPRCKSAIKRAVQAARSTFYCPTCQPNPPGYCRSAFIL